ncbi:alpha/beta fold hydrolase [Kitasatospora sp. NPDC101157]|uniref:alpha/beta fold hydrolase n=1 Tax=Kitasatospora sp. NPDC101157 TaxID=3364098 RepID=UPI0037F2DCAF
MGAYITVRGLRLYYEDQGQGEPVVLLHGGAVTAESWGGQLPALSEHYRVLVPERRGHGRTQDVEGPITYQLMADDMAAFIEELGIGPARVVGWSDGGIVALHLALRRPDLVSKLAVISAGTDEGITQNTQALVDGSEESIQVLTQMFFAPYEILSPDGPEHFPVVLDKLTRMWRQGPQLTLEDLPKITVPVLVMQGDRDGVEVEHSAAMARALPDSQLAVLPGTSHVAPLERPDLVNRMLLDFLTDEQQMRVFPLS